MSDTSLVFNILAKDKASATFTKLQQHAAVAGVAIGAALAAGVTSAMDKTKTDALLAAQLGAGPEMAGVLGEASGQLYARGVVDSIETGNTAIKSAIQNALVPSNASAAALDAIGAKITGLGAVMQEDAGRVSAAVSQMLRTGVAGSAEEAFDLLTVATQKGLNKSGDLLDTVNEYGTQFRQLGLTGPAALGLISQAIQAGARDSDVAADAIKEFAIRTQDGSKASSDALKALGFNADAMRATFARGGPEAAAAMGQVLDALRLTQGQANASEIAFGLFGTKAEDLGQALYAMDLSSAASQFGGLQGAAQRAGDTLEQSAGAKVEALRRQLEMGLVSALGAVAGWIERNSGLVQGLAVVLGPLVAIIGTIIVATKLWGAVQMALNVAMLANPIGLVVLAVVALIAIFAAAWASSEEFRNAITGAWDSISAGADALVAGVSDAWQGMWDKISAFDSWVRSLNPWKTVSEGAEKMWSDVSGWWDGLIRDVERIPGRIDTAVSGMWGGVWESFKSVLNQVIRGWNGLEFTFPPIDLPGIGRVFDGASFGVPDIPYLAKGGHITAAGMAVVGEQGPELVSLPRGAQVTPLSRPGGGVTNVFHITGAIDPIGTAREIEKVLRKYSRETGRTALAF